MTQAQMRVEMIGTPLGLLTIGNLSDGMTILTYCGCAFRADQLIALFMNRE